MLNQVIVSGVVTSIDTDRRDVVISTLTPKGKEVLATVHMWKVQGVDSDDPAHADRDEWRDRIGIGMTVAFRGHLGNGGRVIAAAFAVDERMAEGSVC